MSSSSFGPKSDFNIGAFESTSCNYFSKCLKFPKSLRNAKKNFEKISRTFKSMTISRTFKVHTTISRTAEVQAP